MALEYIDLGDVHPDIDVKYLNHKESIDLLSACLSNSFFTVIELRTLTISDGSLADIIVVECADGTVVSKNETGIKVRERLGLLYCPERKIPYEVRALRSSFPNDTLHQNHTPQGEPSSLCLYFEPWSSVERTWTPESFLKRILWWLRETSRGSLHKEEQPLEPAYFESRFKIILPSNYHEHSDKDGFILNLTPINKQNKNNYDSLTLLGEFTDAESAHSDLSIPDNISVTVNPILLNTILPLPYSLGELEEQLNKLGSSVCDKLKEKILSNINKEGINIPAQDKDNYSLIFVNIPLLRTAGGSPERVHSLCYIAHISLASMGIKLDALYKDPNSNKAYENHSLVGSTETLVDETIFDTVLEPLSVKLRVDSNFSRKVSGITDYQKFRGIIAGVGSLGGSIADIWSKVGWGDWTCIDDDTIEPHNTVRHIARDFHIGKPKAELVSYLMNSNREPHLANSRFINDKVNSDNIEINKIIEESDLLIDISTTLDAPRDLSLKHISTRLVSVFVTPSGSDSVLLFEDRDRNIKLYSLEAQYYRAILHNEWGERHLTGHSGDIWVGGGCRENSVIMSYEMIQLHASILARQIRSNYQNENACIQIWSSKDDGTINSNIIEVTTSETYECGIWSVVWDQFLTNKISEIRTMELPNETGGILIGYIDQKSKHISIVDVCTAPPDSISTPKSFERGTEGLKELLANCGDRTAGIVQYVGEWHSHAENIVTDKSNTDIKQMEFLSTNMSSDGQPGLMAIAGDNELSININTDSIKIKI